MFWRGTWTSIMALIFWAGVMLVIGCFFAYFDFMFLKKSWSDPMAIIGIYMVVGQFGARFVAGFLDILMTAFGHPLFYDLQITDDLNVNAG